MVDRLKIAALWQFSLSYLMMPNTVPVSRTNVIASTALASASAVLKRVLMPEPDNLSHDHDAPTRLDRELHGTGWRPFLMRDEVTGLPFTRWFPPAKDGSPAEDRLLAYDVGRAPTAETR